MQEPLDGPYSPRLTKGLTLRRDDLFERRGSREQLSQREIFYYQPT